MLNLENSGVVTRRDLIAKSRERASRQSGASKVLDELEGLDKKSNYSYAAKSRSSANVLYNRQQLQRKASMAKKNQADALSKVSLFSDVNSQVSKKLTQASV